MKMLWWNYRKAFKDEVIRKIYYKTDKNERNIPIDNAKLIKSRLSKIRIKMKIFMTVKICTVEHNDDWYSYWREGNKVNRIGNHY